MCSKPKAHVDRTPHEVLWTFFRSRNLADIITDYIIDTLVTVWSNSPTMIDLNLADLGSAGAGLRAAQVTAIGEQASDAVMHEALVECPRRGVRHHHYIVERPREDRRTAGCLSIVALRGHLGVLLIDNRAPTSTDARTIIINGRHYLMGPRGSFLTPAGVVDVPAESYRVGSEYFQLKSSVHHLPYLWGPRDATYFLGGIAYEYSRQAAGVGSADDFLRPIRKAVPSAAEAGSNRPWEWTSLPTRLTLRGPVEFRLRGDIASPWPGATRIRCTGGGSAFRLDGSLRAHEGRVVLEADGGAAILVEGAVTARVNTSVVAKGSSAPAGAGSKVRIRGALTGKSVLLHAEDSCALDIDGRLDVGGVMTLVASGKSRVNAPAGGRTFHAQITIRDDAECTIPIYADALHLNLTGRAKLADGPAVRHEVRGVVTDSSTANFTVRSFDCKVHVLPTGCAVTDCRPHSSIMRDY